MPRYLFPRLPDVVANDVCETIESYSVSVLARQSSTFHELTSYAQTGGTRLPVSKLEQIRKALLSIAEENGFPDGGSRESRAEFDAAATRWLGEYREIIPGEALHKEMWSFLALILMPDIVRWRFPDAKASRFIGGVRNAFQRLWIRAYLLGGDRSDDSCWQLIDELTEDAFVAIVERSGLSSYPRLAHAIGLGWSRISKKIGRNKMQGVHREALKRFREIFPVINLDVLEDQGLYELVDDVFELAARNHLRKECEACNGVGLIGEKLCSECDGNGYIEFIRREEEEVRLCSHCHGTGLYEGKVCHVCNGYG